MKPEEKKCLPHVPTYEYLTEEQKQKIRECPLEPTCFECGVALCPQVYGKPNMQVCVPKKKDKKKSEMWKKNVWKEGMWK